MDDLISRAAVVDAIEGVDWYHINKSGEMVQGANPDDHQAWYKAEDIYKAVESVPSAQPTDEEIQRIQDIEQAMLDKAYECGKQDAQEWIPWDSGKLPEESGQYIVTAYDGNISRVTFAKYQKRLKRWELTGARAYWRVLAWCPLPEPWKGEIDE